MILSGPDLNSTIIRRLTLRYSTTKADIQTTPFARWLWQTGSNVNEWGPGAGAKFALVLQSWCKRYPIQITARFSKSGSKIQSQIIVLAMGQQCGRVVVAHYMPP